MKKYLSLLAGVFLAILPTLSLSAQTSLKIVTVDFAKILNGHYRSAEVTSNLRDAQQRTQTELEKLTAEGNALYNQWKELNDQGSNAGLSADAKQKAQTSAKAKIEEIQRKRSEIEVFQQNSTKSLQQRLKTQRDQIIEEITKTITDVSKKKGANLVLDKSGLTLIGTPAVIYGDAVLDISDEVLAEVNRGRASSPNGSLSVPLSSLSTSPAIGVPGLSAPR